MKQNPIIQTVFDAFADEYEKRYMDVHLYHTPLKKFCELISKNEPTILDIGCGPGNISAYLLNSLIPTNVTGIDLSPKMVQLARKNIPRGEFYVMDAREVLSLQKKFDAVIIGFCLPYLSKEESINLLANVHSLMNSNGICYISAIENDYSKSGETINSKGEKINMYYYSETDLKEILQKSNFSVLSVDRVTYEHNQTLVTDIVLIAKR